MLQRPVDDDREHIREGDRTFLFVVPRFAGAAGFTLWSELRAGR